MNKQKIAIACQGGGSQTAFTAGVLKALFDNNIHHDKQIVGLTGTSGGALNAALAWYGLLKAAQGDTDVDWQTDHGFLGRFKGPTSTGTFFGPSRDGRFTQGQRGNLAHA